MSKEALKLAQNMERLKPFVSGLGEAILRELTQDALALAQPEQEQDEASDEMIFHGLEAYKILSSRGTGITRRLTPEERMRIAYRVMRLTALTSPPKRQPVTGWVLVPPKPTVEIMEAAIAAHEKWAWRNFPEMWEAMLEAAHHIKASK